MDIVKIGIIGLTGTILALVLRDDKTFSAIVALSTVLLLLFIIVPYIGDIFNSFIELGQSVNLKENYIKAMLKALGVAYVAMFSSQLCRDFGQNSIGDKIELGGKVVILISAMSIVRELVDEMLRFIE